MLTVELGFVEHVERIRSAGGGYLWPELKRGGPDDKFSHEFSKWFGRYVAEMDLKVKPGETMRDFHSLRHNVATALRGLGVPESVAADILGHQHQTLSYRLYAEGAAVKPLYEAISKLDYGVNLSRVKRVAGHVVGH